MKKSNNSTHTQKQLDIATKCVYALVQEMFDAELLDIEHIATEYRFNKEERAFLSEIVDELYAE